jgi:hypothetical protein
MEAKSVTVGNITMVVEEKKRIRWSLRSFLSGLFGCQHKRTTFPQTPGRGANACRSRTYVACVDCGKEFLYDWNEMRIKK